ncbi:TPA: hypothetical protein N0F65_007738 [Lagenidium giganteum]|uniref:Protein kinase domain-containing protein n=1 Tax=Lagenidium giganteum TaxID=4803 RepID=A0AAV2Z3H3_9STRA|nr:TPA: hypothetical protein N0F65_007738 [Lagenidium giganteum]
MPMRFIRGRKEAKRPSFFQRFGSPIRAGDKKQEEDHAAKAKAAEKGKAGADAKAADANAEDQGTQKAERGRARPKPKPAPAPVADETKDASADKETIKPQDDEKERERSPSKPDEDIEPCPRPVLATDLENANITPYVVVAEPAPTPAPEPQPEPEPERVKVSGPGRTPERRSASRNRKPIRMKDLELGEVLGEGAFGKVYKGRWQHRRVAVKVLIRQDLSPEIIKDFEAEINIMSILHHPNVCQLLGACLEPPRRALVMELSELGSLWCVLRSRRHKFTPDIRAKIIYDTARGMKYLHQFRRPILHRDLKSPNLLVQKDYSIKITDFGLARVKAQIKTMTGNCGTTQWMAPEVLGSRPYTEKADVYSFGIVVWEVFTARCPFENLSQIQVALSVLNHDNRPRVPESCPRFFARLMRACWVRDPEQRPSFAHVVQEIEGHLHRSQQQESQS